MQWILYIQMLLLSSVFFSFKKIFVRHLTELSAESTEH
nr:MAG TPA: hypothetical protein [Caudoviricetes sp.]